MLDPSRVLETPKEMRIRMPTLIIWGVHDIALEKDMAELSTQFVDKVSVKYIENGTHFVQQDKPNEVNEQMNEFLRQQKSLPSS